MISLCRPILATARIDAPSGDQAAPSIACGKSGSSSFQKKSNSFAGKKPYTKSEARSTGQPASTFDKFKGNKKPFGKRAPARKFKSEETESAG